MRKKQLNTQKHIDIPIEKEEADYSSECISISEKYFVSNGLYSMSNFDKGNRLKAYELLHEKYKSITSEDMKSLMQKTKTSGIEMIYLSQFEKNFQNTIKENASNLLNNTNNVKIIVMRFNQQNSRLFAIKHSKYSIFYIVGVETKLGDAYSHG